jgi:hypothetical protein
VTKRKLSRKRLERIRASRLADLDQMLRCIRAGRLPGYEDRCDYLRAALRTPDKLPSREEIKKRLRLRNDDRKANKPWSIAPIDRTAKQLAEDRKQRDRERKMRDRRVRTPQSVRLGPSAGNKIIGADAPSLTSPSPIPAPLGQQGGELHAPSPSPIAWSELDWANMTRDQVKITLAAMEADYWATEPEREARRAKQQAASLARAAVEITKHTRQWEEAYGHETMADCNWRQAWADARL